MRLRSERRGVLLLVMLTMLALLAVIVITYVVVAGIKKRAAAAYERANYYGTPPEEQLQSIALDLLRDTRNPASALQGHSLLADLYGFVNVPMAASTTRPWPLVLASRMAQTMPNARPSAPPASPTTVGGTMGRSPRCAESESMPVSAT